MDESKTLLQRDLIFYVNGKKVGWSVFGYIAEVSYSLSFLCVCEKNYTVSQ